jgi:hypothetical protein
MISTPGYDEGRCEDPFDWRLERRERAKAPCAERVVDARTHYRATPTDYDVSH